MKKILTIVAVLSLLVIVACNKGDDSGSTEQTKTEEVTEQEILMNKSQAMWAVMAMLTIWLCANTAKTNTVEDNSSINTAMVAALMDRMIAMEEHTHIQEAPAVEVPEVKQDNTEQ